MSSADTELALRARGLRSSALVAGPAEGPQVLCLHGFPDHRRSWRHQLPALADAGYRVIAPHLPGYEPSSLTRDGRYTIAALADIVIAWIEQLGDLRPKPHRLHLVGHDWGAIISYAVAAQAPDRLASLTTLAVPHLRRAPGAFARVPVQLVNSAYILLNAYGRLSEPIARARDFAYIRWLWRRWSPGWTCPEGELERLFETLSQPGVLRASLDYYRDVSAIFDRETRRSHALLRRRIETPTLALTGARDGCMDTRIWDHAMSPRDFPGGLRVERIERAGHFLHQERPKRVTRLILDHLEAHPN